MALRGAFHQHSARKKYSKKNAGRTSPPSELRSRVVLIAAQHALRERSVVERRELTGPLLEPLVVVLGRRRLIGLADVEHELSRRHAVAQTGQTRRADGRQMSCQAGHRDIDRLSTSPPRCAVKHRAPQHASTRRHTTARHDTPPCDATPPRRDAPTCPAGAQAQRVVATPAAAPHGSRRPHPHRRGCGKGAERTKPLSRRACSPRNMWKSRWQCTCHMPALVASRRST